MGLCETKHHQPNERNGHQFEKAAHRMVKIALTSEK
jgi:hypothetical protein